MPLWRDFMKTAPEQLSGLAEFSTIPEDPAFPEEAWGRRVVALAHVYDGPADDGEKVAEPLRNFGTPLVDFSGRMPYRTLQSLYDGLFPKGRDRCYWKSTYLKGLDDNLIREITSRLADRPSEMTFTSIWKFGGAVQRVPADDTAFGDRSMPFMLSLDAIWSSPQMMSQYLVGARCWIACSAIRQAACTSTFPAMVKAPISFATHTEPNPTPVFKPSSGASIRTTCSA